MYVDLAIIKENSVASFFVHIEKIKLYFLIYTEELSTISKLIPRYQNTKKRFNKKPHFRKLSIRNVVNTQLMAQ